MVNNMGPMEIDSIVLGAKLRPRVVLGAPTGAILYVRGRQVKSSTYTVVLQQTDEGFSVGCPGLPGCWSEGSTEQEALANIRIAIQEYLAAIRDSVAGAEVREVEVAV
jgi:predicted RNase H-like HicB family nuclease